MRRRRAVVPLRRRGPLVERRNFGIVRVYLDDIEEITAILGQVAASVRIQADEFVTTDPSDMLDMPSDVINSLSIVAVDPSITITLSRTAATAEATDPDMVVLGALTKIEELLQRRRRRLKFFIWSGGGDDPSSLGTSILFLILGIAGVIAAVVGLLAEGDNPSEPELSRGWIIAIGIVSSILLVGYLTLGTRRYATVIPRSQKDAPPFWERNKDEMAINAIFTVIGGVLGIVGTLLLQSLGDR
jgi:hypothetical protein